MDLTTGLGKITKQLLPEDRHLPMQQVSFLHDTNIDKLKGKILYKLASISPLIEAGDIVELS